MRCGPSTTSVGAARMWKVPQCRLSPRGIIELRAAVAEVINHNEDHVLLLDLGPAEGGKPRVSSLGKSFEAVERRPVIV